MQQTAEKKELFEKMPIPKAILAMALPTIISNVITLIYNMSDTFFIGRTGDSLMVAGMSVCYTAVVLTTTFVNLFGIGGGNLISRYNGKGEFDKARTICSMSFYGSLLSGVLYSIAMYIFMDPILYALGASDATILYARQYAIVVIVAGSIPTILSTTLAHLLRNVGYSKQASYGLSGGGILNIILDPLFMFVILPEGYEVLGAAIATLISNVLSCLFLLWQFLKVSKSATLSASPKYLKNMTGSDVKLLLKTGFPSALLICLYDTSNMFLFGLMASHGDLAVAAIGIVIKIERIPNSLGIAIAQSLAPLVSYNLGHKDIKRMEGFVKTGRLYGIVMTLFCVLIYQLFATPLCNFFLNTNVGDVETSLMTIAIAGGFLRIRCCGSPFMFLNYHSSYCLQAMGDVKDAIFHTLIRIVGFTIPLLYLFNHLFQANGLCIALPVGEFLACIFATIFLQNWIKKCFRRMEAENGSPAEVRAE